MYSKKITVTQFTVTEKFLQLFKKSTVTPEKSEVIPGVEKTETFEKHNFILRVLEVAWVGE